MKTEPSSWQCEIDVRPGESLKVPDSIVKQVGTGRWRLTVESVSAMRSHAAFLNSYAPSDEGLYDDCVPG